MKEDIVITGASGQMGAAILRNLFNRGASKAHLIACVRDPSKSSEQMLQCSEVRKADYDDLASLRQAFQGAGTLLFISSPETEGARRVLQHAQVVKAAVDAGIERIVYTGFAFAERSQIPLAQHHLATEHTIRASEIPFTFLRNAFYTELFVNQRLRSAVQSGEIFSNAGDSPLNSVSREDLASAAATVLMTRGHEYKSYNLVATRPWTYRDLAALVAELSGKNVVHRSVSHEAMVGHLVAEGMPPQVAHVTAFVHGRMAEGEGSHRSRDLEHLIGEPTPLRETVARALSEGKQ